MSKSKFTTQLIIVAIISLIIAIAFQELLFVEDHIILLLVEIVLFIVSAFFIHQIAITAAKSENKYAFSRITMANTFVKLFMVVGLVVIYKVAVKPTEINFVWPFIIIYILFTVFETKFLMKLARI